MKRWLGLWFVWAGLGCAGESPDASVGPGQVGQGEVGQRAPSRAVCQDEELFTLLSAVEHDTAVYQAGTLSLCGDDEEGARFCVQAEVPTADAPWSWSVMRPEPLDLTYLPTPSLFGEGLIREGGPGSEAEPSVLKYCSPETLRCEVIYQAGAASGEGAAGEAQGQGASEKILGAQLSPSAQEVVLTVANAAEVEAVVLNLVSKEERLRQKIGDALMLGCTGVSYLPRPWVSPLEARCAVREGRACEPGVSAAFWSPASACQQAEICEALVPPADLLMRAGACSGPGSSWVADGRTGVRRFWVGGAEGAMVRAEEGVAYRDGQWVFWDAAGERIVIQGLSQGEVRGSVAMGEALGDSQPKGDGRFLRTDGERIVVVASRPQRGTVLVFGPELQLETRFDPRPCFH